MSASPALDATFAALSDPTRRAILRRLAAGECSVSELAAPLNTSLPAISKHLRVLENAGMLASRKDGRVRRCRLVTAPLKSAADWILQNRRFWAAQFDSLEGYLKRTTPNERRR